MKAWNKWTMGENMPVGDTVLSTMLVLKNKWMAMSYMCKNKLYSKPVNQWH